MFGSRARTSSRGHDRTDRTRRIGSPSDAVMAAITDRSYTTEEKRWVERIEQRRQALCASFDVIEYVDYGAGSSSATRTAEEMERGAPRRTAVADLTRIASKSPTWAGLLFRLVRDVGPTRCLELGAAAGISGAYQAAALELNGAGRLTSLEGGASIAALASSTLTALGLDRRADVRVGRFQDTLDDALSGESCDYAFIDGHHDDDATRHYFAAITNRMTRPGLAVLDDIAWSPGMRAAWQHVSRDPVVAASFDLGAVGICVVDDVRRPFHCTIDYA